MNEFKLKQELSKDDVVNFQADTDEINEEIQINELTNKFNLHEDELKLVEEIDTTNEDEGEDRGLKETRKASIKSDIDYNNKNKYIKNIDNAMEKENVDKNKAEEDIHVLDKDKQEDIDQHLENHNSIEDENIIDTDNKSIDKKNVKQGMNKRKNNQHIFNSPRKENGIKHDHGDEVDVDIKLKQEIEKDCMYDAYEDHNKIIKKYRLRQGKSKIVKIEVPEEKINPNTLYRKKRWYVDDEFVYPLKCDKCKKTFNSKTGLLNHLRMHQTEQMFTCLLCQKEFQTNAELKDHKKLHDEDDLSFTCERCQQAFSSHLDYLLHELRHMHRSSYRCKECGKTYYHKTSFQIHIETHFHTQYVCKICDKTFKSESAYRTHLRFHTNASAYECMECGKRCTDKKGLDYHMVSHTGVKRQQCLYCGKGFASTNIRDVHTRTHTDERPYECKICYQKFKQSGDVKKHMHTHETEKRFECEICKKKFISVEGLRLHTRLHTSSKKFPCLECGKTFPIYASLRSHTLYKHTTERPHKCEACNLAFAEKCDLTRHNKSKRHKNNMFGLTSK